MGGNGGKEVFARGNFLICLKSYKANARFSALFYTLFCETLEMTDDSRKKRKSISHGERGEGMLATEDLGKHL